MNQIKNLDRLIHEPLRLVIVNALAANQSLTFNELKDLTNTTDGNVSVHCRKLEQSGYVKCSKSFEGRIPKTNYKLTTKGRRALDDYFVQIEALVWSHRLNSISRTLTKGIRDLECARWHTPCPV